MFRSLPLAATAFSLLGGSALQLVAQTDVKATLTDTTPAATKKNPGDVIDYRVTVTNAATATGSANNPVVNLPTPPGTTIVPGSVNMSPIVYDESYNTLPNTRLVIDAAHGLTFNDADDKGSVTVVNVTRLDGTGTTNATPGTLSANANGSFTYTPGVGATGSERFQYSLRDSDNVLSVSPGIVTFTLSGPRIWFVQGGAAAGGNGQSYSPFSTPEAASTAATGTDMIYAIGSATALNGLVTLEDGQELRGQGVALSVATGHPSYSGSPLEIFPATTAPVLTNTAGNIVTLAAGATAAKTIAGVNLGNRSGSAISGSSFGTLAVGSTVSTSGSGQVLGLTTGAIGGTFVSLSTSSAATAVSLTGITGTLSATAVNISGVTSDLFNINGGTVTLSLPANYTFSGTTATGRSLNISNRGASGNLTFNNKVINSGAGILLDNNDSATITFRSLNLTTGANTAFSAINGGTVVVSNALTDGIDNDADGSTDEIDEANTITTTTGTALNVVGTNIGGGGMIFRSISAGTAASGPVNGIVLSNTGNSAGLTVTGDGGGSNNSSGGTIRKTSGAGVSLSSTSNVSLGYMNIQDAGDDGISGTSVTGFVLNRSNVINNGDAVNEDGVDFGGSGVVTPNGLFGSANVTNSVFTGNYYNQFTVRNSSGTVGLAITGSTFSGKVAENNNNDGLFLEVLATGTITANAQNSTFSANKGDHFQAAASNSGNLNVTFKTNTLTGGHSSALGQGITINAATGLAFGGYTGTVNYDIDGNTINGSILSAITVNLGTSNPPALFNGFIRNNTIGTTGVLNSGSAQGYGIAWDAHGKGTHTSSVTNNIVREALDRGMGVIVNDGSPVTNLTITGNNLRPTANDATGSREAVEFNLGSTGTNVFGEIDSPTVRVNLSGNTLVGGAFKNGDIRMRQRFGARVEMPSYGGTPFSTANVISYLQGNNAGTVATAVATDNASFTTDGYFGGTVSAPGTIPQPLLFAAAETASAMPVEQQSSVLAAPMEPVSMPAAEVISAQKSSSEIQPLTQAELDRMVALARERWETAGLSGEQQAALDALNFEVTDLPGWHLGEAGGKKIRIDRDAGGHGWFVDGTPADDREFTTEGGRLMANAGSKDQSEATDRVDLLTTLLHEMGHTIGLCDSYAEQQRGSVMYGFLAKGERRLPEKGEATGAVPHEHETPHYLDAPLGLPAGYTNLPPGKGFRIYYQVTVNNPLTVAPISSQGTVTGDNFATVTTDDVVNDTDAPVGGADPTVTLIDRPDATVVSLNRASGNPRNAPTATWQVVFSQPVSNLTAANFSLVNTGLGGSPAISSATEASGPPSTTWNVTASTGTGSGSLGINLVNDTGLLHDITNAPFTGQVFTIDRISPTVAITSAAANPTNVSPIPVTVTFNENVIDFTDADITPGNATVANFSGSGATYTFDLVPAGQGTVTAGITAGVAQDEAGNDNVAAAQFSRDYDSTVPTVAMTSATGNPATNAAIPVSVTFSESVTGFTDTDIVPGNATVANFAGSGASYTFDLVPSGPGVTATADIAAGVAQDAALNSNTAAIQFSRTVTDAVSIAATTANAVEGGTTGLYTFSRGASSGDVTVNFQLDAASTATAGTDFTLSSAQAVTFDEGTGAGTLVIPDGSLTATITLTALTETPNRAEAAETARLNITSGTGYVPASTPGDSATVTVVANGFVVVNTNDSGEGSLRQAVLNANELGGNPAITFDTTLSGSPFAAATSASPAEITLTSGQLAISSSLTVQGLGARVLHLSGNESSRVIDIASGSHNVTLVGLTIGNGAVTDGYGAGIRCQSDGALVIRSCSIENNQLTNTGGSAESGAGIFRSGGSFLIEGSTVSGNVMTNGPGGGMSLQGAMVDIVNCTISGNVAIQGAGIFGQTMTGRLIHSTVTANTASSNGGGMFLVGNGILTLGNSVIAGNNGASAKDISRLLVSTIITPGGNLIGIDSGSMLTAGTPNANGDWVGTSAAPLDPVIGSLTDNGGPTDTHALLAGSPALNAGNPAAVPADTLDLDGDEDVAEPWPFDQRGTGFNREIGLPDIGAFELQKSVFITADLASANEGTGAGTTDFTFTVTRSGGTSGTVTVDYAVTGAGGNPADAADFGGTLPSGEVTIADGSETATVTIPVSKDAVREANEGFQVTLSDPDNSYVVSGTPATSTITNDDFEADLAITKTDGVTTAIPGNSVTYTITASNAGPDPVVGATVADTFPASLTATWTAVGAGGGTVTAAGSGNINDTVNLPVGGSVTYTVTATISPAATGTLSNTATVSSAVTDPSPANNSATDTDTLIPQADLSITKTDGVTTAIPGNSVTYTITASNAGPSNATATVADTFPASLTATWTAVGAGGGTVTASGSGNINETVNLPVGGSVTFTVSATISPAATGTLSNTATVTSAVTDPTPGNNSATDSDTLTPRSDLELLLSTPSSPSAVPGTAMTYTIKVSNLSLSNAPGATVTDVFPAAFTNVSWTAVTAGGATATGAGTGNINEVVNLPTGSSVTYTVTGTINPGATGTLDNSADVTAPASVPDVDLSNNAGSTATTLTPQAGLSITKTDGVTTATPGGSVTYTITATNAGPSAVTGATVADTLPASLTATWTSAVAGGATATASGSGNINDTVNLPVGASVTYTVSATISAAASGTLSNTATIAAPAGVTDPTPGDNSATDSDTLQAQADLVITKTDGVTTATPGGTVTYTITASNAGPSNVTGATVADTFPASLTATWTSAVAGGATATASGSGNINDTVNLPAGGSVTYTVTATISPSATGTLANTATVSSSVTDPTPGNNSATDTDTLTPQADLAITKTDGATTAIPGGTVTYTITASNSGPSNAPGATVADTLPATLTGVTWTAVGAGGGTVTASGTGNINDTVNLPAGGSVTYTVTGTISAAATGSLSNTATVAAPAGVTDPTPGNNSATDTDTLTPQVDLSITKTDGVTSAVPGTSVTYTITASNAGPSNAPGATVADTLPATLTGVTWAAVGAGGGSATAAGSGNINDTVNLPAGGSVTYTVTGTISSTATGTLSNTATVAAPAGATDTNPANNSATDSDTLTPRANLTITKTDGVTTAIPGNSVTYTITATNAGPSAVTGATVADTLPASLTATWTSAVAGGATATASGSGNINDTVNLPVGGSVTYTVSATISAAATGSLTNTATVAAPAGVTDPTPGDNSATDTDTLNAQADLSITKTDGVTTAIPGGSVTYTITASNAGPSNATSVSVADTLPASISGATWTGAGAGGGTGPASGSGNINATSINLPAGGSFTFTVTAPISAAATGTLVNTATVSSAATDPNPANNSATDTDTLTPRANLAITKTDGVTTAVPGTAVTYTITASNTGPSNAPGVVINDTLPDILTGATWTAVGSGGGTATASGTGDINDTVNLPAGSSVTYTLTATISPTATGSLSNMAAVTAPPGVTDPIPFNDRQTDTDTLTPQANLALTMTDSPDPVNALGNLTYSIGLTNNGPSASASPQVTLPLPAGTTFVSASAPAGWTPSTPAVGATGTVTFTASSIATGGTASFTVVAKVNIDIVNDSILSATATASSATADPTPGNNTATTTTTAKSGADIELTLVDTPDPVNAGTDLTYAIGLTNHGPLDADNVSVTETLPTGTTFVSLSTPAGWSATTPAVGSAGTVTITRSSFANAATANFTLVIKVAPNVAAGTVLSGSATVSSTTVDIVPANNSATATTTISTQADLAVAIAANPTTAPKGSDVTFSVGVSNQGPSDASSPVVTLPLPANMTFVSAVAPAGWTTNAPSVGATGTVTFSATTLATGGTGDFTVVAKVNSSTPNGTVLTATATTSSTAGDSQTANNTATATVAVGTVLPTVVQPVTTGFTVNPQSGLFEVNVNVTNTTPNAINGFRLHVDYNSYKAAFPSLRLYNASSPANAQDVYVDHPFPVAVDGVITLKLSFYTSTRTFPSPFTPQLTVEILPSSQLPGTNAAGVDPRVVGFSNGNLLLEFPSVVGRWYRVRYSSDLINWHDSPVPLQAGSTRMQWIDSGPPFTNVPPSQAPSRYYRVNEIAAP